MKTLQEETSMTTNGTGAVAQPSKRLNFAISERARQELEVIAREHDRTMTDVIRLGISLAKIALGASRRGEKILIAREDGEPIRELVLPN
jgi:hypothetical protein